MVKKKKGSTMNIKEAAEEVLQESYLKAFSKIDTLKQPELSYIKEETKGLVHYLLDGLSDEQRMSILMFHIENTSISEIAQAMDCSENTVKSRLNYGRKN